jgi:ATP-binding cassette subfamily C (CFTR/MRP) protein 4
MIASVRKVLASKPADQQAIDVEDTPNILFEERCRKLSKDLDEAIQTRTQGEQLTDSMMFSITVRNYRWEFLSTLVPCLLEATSRVSASVVIQLLIQAVVVKNFQSAYMYAGILTALYFMLLRCSDTILTTEPRCCLPRCDRVSSFCSTKESRNLSQFMVKSADMGKLVNLLASDFNTMDERLLLATMAFGLPFLLFGVAVVLVIRLGWFGLICIFTPIVFTVIPVIVGRVNGRILTKLNVHKDERIKTTGEAIEGIRFVKLYAWELAFSRIIGKLRDLEVSHYVRISVGQSVSRSLASFVSIGGVLICFVAMYYSNVRFDSSMIFSTMEIMLFLKINYFLSLTGLSYLFELKVLFKRFADIYNMENISMRRLDEVTKQPIPEMKNISPLDPNIPPLSS